MTDDLLLVDDGHATADLHLALEATDPCPWDDGLTVGDEGCVEPAEPVDCDGWAGLVPAETGDGCVLQVEVAGVVESWMLVLVVFASFVLVALGALVVGNLGRR